MISKHDIVKLKFEFAIERQDIDEFINAISKTKIFQQCMEKDDMNCMQLIRMIQYIPTEPIEQSKLYANIRKRGFIRKREKFLEELYYLESYGFIKQFKDFLSQDTYVQNIADAETIIEINAVNNK